MEKLVTLVLICAWGCTIPEFTRTADDFVQEVCADPPEDLRHACGQER